MNTNSLGDSQTCISVPLKQSSGVACSLFNAVLRGEMLQLYLVINVAGL